MNRDQLRAAMPKVAAAVDQYRRWLANGGRLIYASENGHVIDRREPEGNGYELEPQRFARHLKETHHAAR